MKLKRFSMEIPLVEDATKEESKKEYIKVTYKDEDGEHTEIYDVDTWEDVKKTCEGRSDVEPFEVISEEYVDESETKEFGLGDKIKRGLRRGKDRFINRAINKDKGTYKAGVVYLEVTQTNTSISYKLSHKGTKAFKSAKEANDAIPELIKEIWGKNPKGVSELSEDKTAITYKYPIIKMKAVVSGNYETEIQNEIGDALESSNWKKLTEPKIKTIKS